MVWGILTKWFSKPIIGQHSVHDHGERLPNFHVAVYMETPVLLPYVLGSCCSPKRGMASRCWASQQTVGSSDFTKVTDTEFTYKVLKPYSRDPPHVLKTVHNWWTSRQTALGKLDVCASVYTYLHAQCMHVVMLLLCVHVLLNRNSTSQSHGPTNWNCTMMESPELRHLDTHWLLSSNMSMSI